MSLITQCPACSTMFRVVPDQLRISEGWVRCGQCDEVFDANAHLQNYAEPQRATEPDPAPPAEPHPEHFPAPRHVPENPVDAYDWGPVLGEPEQPAALEAEEENAPMRDGLTPTAFQNPNEPYFDEPVAVAHGEATEPLPAMDAFLAQSPHGPTQAEPMAGVDELPQPALEPAPQMDAHGEGAVADESLAPEAGAQASDEMPLSFMRQSPDSTLPGRPWVRNALVLLCVLLSAVLALQYLLAEKDRLAATAPSLRPLLVASCEWLGCTVSAPRQIESIAIESSTFTSLKPGVYVLNLTVKNTAAIELAAPALELTLTGMQDQALLRKVLLSAETLGKQQIPAGAELSTSLPVRVLAGAAAEKIAGYKLLAFYP